jgi:hypothetical protein
MSQIVSYHRVKSSFKFQSEEPYVTSLVTEILDLHTCLNKMKGIFFPPQILTMV